MEDTITYLVYKNELGEHWFTPAASNYNNSIDPSIGSVNSNGEKVIGIGTLDMAEKLCAANPIKKQDLFSSFA